MSTRLWVADNGGDVLCQDHVGTYLASAIKSAPEATEHDTPLDTWALYFTHVIGGDGLVCEVCTPLDSPSHPYSKVKATT
jgi:hypothetical protein